MQETKLIGTDFDATFGRFVAVSGNTLAVGAGDTKRFPLGSGSGAVYVFSKVDNTWTLETRIEPSNRLGHDDVFGSVLSMSGNTLVASGVAGTSDQPNLVVDVFSRNGSIWSEDAELIAPSGADSVEAFGASVALSGDTLVVGAPETLLLGFPIGEGSPGSAYVYIRENGTWSLEAKLVADDGVRGDGFGGAVAVDGDTIAVGAPFAIEKGQPVYLFMRDGKAWIPSAKLTGGSLVIGGNSLAINADLLAIVGNGVRIFEKNAGLWHENWRLAYPNDDQEDTFSTLVGSVALASCCCLGG